MNLWRIGENYMRPRLTGISLFDPLNEWVSEHEVLLNLRFEGSREAEPDWPETADTYSTLEDRSNDFFGGGEVLSI